jgi:PAS domain S-box-containing protein
MTTLRQHDQFDGGIMNRTMAGVINWWNPGAEELYGWRKEEAVGRTSHDLLQTQFPKPLAEIEDELVRTGWWKGKLVHTARDGSRIVVESHWSLRFEGESPAIVEFNTCSAEHAAAGAHFDNIDPARKSSDSLSKFANIILAGAAFLCLLLFTKFIYEYGWTARKAFSTSVFMVVYWVVPAILASIFFGLLQRSRELRMNVALLCVSITASIYAVETLLSFYTSLYSDRSATLWAGHHQKQMKEVVELAKAYGVDFDTRSKASVVSELRSRNIRAVPNISPIELLKEQPDGAFRSAIALDGSEVLPIGGVSDSFVVFCNETGTYATYQSDEHGFHNPSGMWRSSQISIAGLGDSFAEGACVASEKNFMALIRKQYPGTLNLGTSGSGPMIMFAALKEYLPSVRPKIVLWFFYEDNDFTELLKEGRSPLLRNYLKPEFKLNLSQQQKDIDAALNSYIQEALQAELLQTEEATGDHSKFGTLTKIFKLGHLRQTLGLVTRQSARAPEDVEYSDRQLGLFREVLIEAKAVVDRWGGSLYFVYLPGRDRYANGADYRREKILRIVKETGIPLIDVHARFELEKDPLKMFPFRRFGHYNEEGHRIVAEEVLRTLHSPTLRSAKGLSLQ